MSAALATDNALEVTSAITPAETHNFFIVRLLSCCGSDFTIFGRPSAVAQLAGYLQ